MYRTIYSPRWTWQKHFTCCLLLTLLNYRSYTTDLDWVYFTNQMLILKEKFIIAWVLSTVSKLVHLICRDHRRSGILSRWLIPAGGDNIELVLCLLLDRNTLSCWNHGGVCLGPDVGLSVVGQRHAVLDPQVVQDRGVLVLHVLVADLAQAGVMWGLGLRLGN